jgi:hypothetical protein
MATDSDRHEGREFIRAPGTQLYDLHEHALVREILFGSARLYEFFGFAMTDVHGLKSQDGWEYLFYGNIPRKDLGLPEAGQPGDIDVLIVPHRDGKVHVDKAAAIEVKRLSLKGPRWHKASDRYGITQANGLLAAGFPYVGVLHLIVHADGPEENFKETQTYRVIGDDGRAELEDTNITNMTGWIAAERQLGRLMAQSPHDAIGLNCVSLADVTRRGKSGVMVGTPNGRAANHNPFTTAERLSYIAAFMRSMKSRVFEPHSTVRR